MSPAAAELVLRVGRASRERRRALGASQEGFADAIGMHRTYYGAFERGEKNFSVSTLQRVASGLGISVSKLLERAETRDGQT